MTVLIIHAKKLTDRLPHIENQLKKHLAGYEWQYILDADKEELTEELLDQYFVVGTEMHKMTSAASCSLKHLLACQYVVDHQLDGALILEDDIILHKNFRPMMEKSLAEHQNRFSDRPVFVSYEDSSLQFVPRSIRKKNQMLYKSPAWRTRFAGCYYVNNLAAKAIVDYAHHQKLGMPIDHLHITLYDLKQMDIYWCHPAIATQGSCSGLFLSSVGQRRWLENVRWLLKLSYKRILYWLR